MEKLEILAKAWIECDPNRQPADPDDPLVFPGSDLHGKPKWHWFIPRAEALEEYLSKHGLEIVPSAPA